MNFWLFMFRPETYECVRGHQVVGVLPTQGERFGEVAEGDPFVVYVSRSRLLDAHGVVVGAPFHDTSPVFGPGSEKYAFRAAVRLEGTGLSRDASKLLYGLSAFESGLSTSPANYIFCRGGFLKITGEDYHWLLGCMKGEIQPKWEGSEWE